MTGACFIVVLNRRGMRVNTTTNLQTFMMIMMMILRTKSSFKVDVNRVWYSGLQGLLRQMEQGVILNQYSTKQPQCP